MIQKKILVSACLAGERCRYNCGDVTHAGVARLVERGMAVPVCPEMAGGLPAPREPVEIVDGRAMAKDGVDCTKQFELGVQKSLEVFIQEGCDCAILKAFSPTCGSGLIYDGSFTGTRIPGDGMFAAALKARGVHILTEQDADKSFFKQA